MSRMKHILYTKITSQFLSIFRGEFVAISSYVIYFNLDDESNVGNMF